MALQMRGIHKAFGANEVLKGVDFELKDGEIQALLGENGAGKSTLMNILGGVIQADAGEILLDGRPVVFDSPRASLDAGVAFIHQELNLVNDLMVYENLFLGREKRGRGGFLDAKAMIREAQNVFERMGIRMNPRAMVGSLDASYKQVVEIARALMMNARIIIMDEPTTSLTEVEIERVFDMMRGVRDQGVSLVFISHKLGEVKRVCDSYSVLRDGALVARGSVQDVTERELAQHMVGHEIRVREWAGQPAAGETALEVKNLSGDAFEGISFSLRRGEVLGFTGLLGDGRSELFQTIFGCGGRCQGEIWVKGQKVKIAGTGRAMELGLGYVPRNRKENGIVKDMSILENASLTTLKRLKKGLLLDHKKERAVFAGQKKELHIKMGSEDDSITSLSGGNQQKVVLAKWLSANPEIMIFDNPTQGVDVGAKEEIYQIIQILKQRGVAVAVLSGEAQEIARLCDRALVMYHGRIQGELKRQEITEENVMLLATGAVGGAKE